MADPAPTQVPPSSYVNVARVRHTKTEVYLDFGQLSLDHAGVASVISQLVMTPHHAKQLLIVLKSNVERYEQSYGEIEIPPAPKPRTVR